jgi:hypothetical protein
MTLGGGNPNGCGTAVQYRSRLARTGRRRIVRLARHHQWADLIVDAITRLRLLTAPG